MPAFFASCGKGLEYLLVDELLALGCRKATATTAGVNVEGELIDAQRAVLWSRLASRIVWPLQAFDCADEQALYAGARSIDWTRHIPPDATIAVDAHVSGEGITHARFAAQRVKDAMVDVLREATGARPDVDVESPDVRIHLLVRKGRAQIGIDVGGGPMHRRGWRRQQVDAPLKENLAAAMLVRANWSQRYAQGEALFDPMCGSGTLVIEAALMAADVAPGLQRHGEAAPTRWCGWDAGAWAALRQEAQQRADTGLARLRTCFLGSDIDPRAIAMARSNADAAGVAAAIDWQVADIAALPAHAVLLQAHGVVVSNPPYAQRLAADPALYRALGDALRQHVPAWSATLLCGDRELAFATGLRGKRTYTLFNGALECTLLLVDPIAVATKAAGDVVRPLQDDAQMVANRLRKNLEKSRRWRLREQVSCYRVYDADIPEYACAVDVYTGIDDGQTWLHVQEYAAPAEIPVEVTRRRLNALLAAVRDVFAVAREQVAIKTRSTGKGGSKYGQFDSRAQRLTVGEGGVRLQVNLFDYLDTGLFLDHRPMRLRLAQECSGRRFLNLFCYTGAATVHAAVGGAAQTTSVDLSATYLEWLSDNLRENGIGGPQHALVQADAMAWLAADVGRYDVVFCDPPTFSNSKRAEDFDVQRDHVALLQRVMSRLAHGGTVYFSNNFRRFRLDVEALSTFANVEDISVETLPQDFARNPRIHRCWRLTRHA